MACLSGFRPPQFSEDSAWLPTWLHHCNFDQLNVEGTKQDQITFEQRVEELKFLQDGESLRGEGGCNIGQLFISESDSSPFSFAQSANNGVVQFHLHLSSSGDDSENTYLTTDVRQTNSNYRAIPPLEDSGISVQGDINKKAANRSPSLGLDRPISKIELLKQDENVNLSEAADDVVELCIAASEAMVLNEFIESDSCSASCILEASLQVKRARLEVWNNTITSSTHVTSETDSLSDLDDITMESAYEDAGIYLNKFSGNELSVSQVKDTFNDSCARIMEDVIDNAVQLGNDSTEECSDGDTRKTVIGNPVCGLDTDVDVGYEDYRSRTVDTHTELHFSVSAEGANTLTAENSAHEINESSPTTSCQGKDHSVPNIVQEQFKSRWFGGWTSNTPQNEVKYTTAKHSIPEPFACETSFLSESAPDQNSFVQNHDKRAIASSQLNTCTVNFYNRAIDDETLLSQDVRSSNTSLMDPLCSVVPCSISENKCSSPARIYSDKLNPGHLDITTECEKDNNAQGENFGTPIASIKESRNGVSRRFTSLADYSKQFPIHTKFSGIDYGQEYSFPKDSNIELTFQENREENLKVGAEFSNKENTYTLTHLMDERRKSHLWASNSTDNEENPTQTALPERKTQSILKLRASKRVRFCEEEAEITDKKKLKTAQTESKTCSSTRVSKKSTKLSAYLESRAQRMDKERKRLIFQNMDFLLTGFSQKKEKEVEGLIRKYGGIVLYQLPSINLKEKRSSRFNSRALPIVLCLKKIQSFKFLYGCAVNGYVLKVNWLNDSIAAGFVLPPKKYMIIPRNINISQDQVYTAVNYNISSLVFNDVGVILHGKTKYFTNIATIIKHGGGQVFKTLQKLVQALEAGKISMGIVIVHDENCASRHLKHCALEKNIPMTSVHWIIKSLYARQLISLEEEEKSNLRSSPSIKLQRHQDSMELSQEI